MRSPAAWAFAIVVGFPMLAEAQQGGLFPLAHVRRPRVPCEMENPVYSLYRHEYYGYHPTCWRRFPAGWGCPTPEAPNAAAEFQRQPRDPAPVGAPPLGDEEPVPPGPGAPDEAAVPPLPDPGRTPFQLDRGLNGDRPAPNAPPRRPPASRNPLDLPAPPPTDDAAAPPAAAEAPATGLLDTPVEPGADGAPLLALPEPGSAPASAPAPSLAPAPATAPPPAAAAVAVPPGAPPVPPMVAPGVNQGNPLSRPITPSAYAPAHPVQAPRRTSLLGGLFAGANRTRR